MCARVSVCVRCVCLSFANAPPHTHASRRPNHVRRRLHLAARPASRPLRQSPAARPPPALPLPTVRWHPRPREAEQMGGKATRRRETSQVSLATVPQPPVIGHESRVASRYQPSPTLNSSWRRPGSGLTDLRRDWAGFASFASFSSAFLQLSSPCICLHHICPVL